MLVPTTRSGKKLIGKPAICPFCNHLHPKAVHARLAAERHGRDEFLVAADLDPDVGKPTSGPVFASEAQTGGLLALGAFEALRIASDHSQALMYAARARSS